MIDVRVVFVFLFLAGFIGLYTASLGISIQHRITLACFLGAFMGLCFAFVSDRGNK